MDQRTLVPPHLAPLCTLIPYNPKYQMNYSHHRVRAIQAWKLAELEQKAYAETFGESASQIFIRSIKKDLIKRNMLDGKVAPGYPEQDFILDFENILKDVINLAQTPPTSQAMQTLLPLLPHELGPTLQKSFQTVVKDYKDYLIMQVRKAAATGEKDEGSDDDDEQDEE